ncbi:hypothetical protein GQ53DRAFT_812937 [Thozetella sp. PMI_491]|nr:hypothetical protein GQ53DRAFT_812937 [Thozetella sp. PMI_491]
MADGNSTASSGGGQDSSDNALMLQLTIAAFTISIVALAFLTTVRWDGGDARKKSWAKEWASMTTRKFKWREWRYQVFFEVPVFYTAPLGITVGPLTLTKPELTLKTIVNRVLRGPEPEPEPVSTIEPEAVDLEVIKLQRHVAPIYKITGTPTSYKHTLTNLTDRKDEKWANVHTAEDEGCSWVLLLDALQGQERASRLWDRGPKNRGLDHTICYLIQRKRRCWDFMPLNTTKPFATTNICHLVEIMSMLGLVWTEFDVKASLLSAEGNGYMVKSEYTPGLGILTRFSRLSKPVHAGDRIIPCDEIKRLCFGDVPSLFDEMGQKLQVGPALLESTLTQLLPDLDAEQRKLFLPQASSSGQPASFLITPTFQLIAMVGKSVHIPGSRFRRLPNPCSDAPPAGLNTAACLSAFAVMVKTSPDLGSHVLTQEIKNSFEHGRLDGIVSLDPAEGRTLEQLINNYLSANGTLEDEKAERFFAPAGERDSRKKSAENRYNDALLHLLDALHTAVRAIDQRLKHQDVRDDVRKVVTLHFAEMFDRIDELKGKPGRGGSKERRLVAFHFDSVRPAVARGGAASSAASTASTVTSGSAGPLSPAEMQRSAVWLALMFRMWSWLFLHQFNPIDRMIERSKFQNSRLPVYIG